MSAGVLVYVVGEPGVGKSTAMAAATAGWARAALPGQPGREALIDPRGYRLVGVELGRRRPGGFSGTDALPMDATVPACRYLRCGRAADETSLLLGEGARLGHVRFLAAAAAAGWVVHLVHILGAELAEQRRVARGNQQDPAWVRGAATRAARLASRPPPDVRVHYVDAADRPADLIAELAGRDPPPPPLKT
ncbi:MAG: P-loop-containing protein [Pseudonocardiaceae bacterium]